MKRAFVETPDGAVHYRFEGSGDPLLLLHQTPMSSDEYAQVIPILARKYRVIAPDTLGYGDSEAPSRPYTIPDYARSVIRFLDALGIKKTDLVGHHTGASIAVEIAARYPDRVARLVLSGCPCFKPEEAPVWQAKYPPIEIKADGSHLMKVWDMAMQRFPATRLDLAQAYTLDFLKSGLGDRTEAGHHAVFAYEAAARLPLIKSDTLLVMGDKDIVCQYLDSVRSLVPNNKVRVVKEGTASILRLMPREWAEAVLDFLRG